MRAVQWGKNNESTTRDLYSELQEVKVQEDYKLSHYMLKKQTLYAHKMTSGKLQWSLAEDDVHLAHAYATLCASVWYYLSQHPSVAHVPLTNIITAF